MTGPSKISTARAGIEPRSTAFRGGHLYYEANEMVAVGKVYICTLFGYCLDIVVSI